uniref:Uncharacterized protein n=1 Tax=Trichogramma kaykai TaxID=54128 RepID=A0ABD2WBY7_9HYME
MILFLQNSNFELYALTEDIICMRLPRGFSLNQYDTNVLLLLRIDRRKKLVVVCSVNLRSLSSSDTALSQMSDVVISPVHWGQAFLGVDLAIFASHAYDTRPISFLAFSVTELATLWSSAIATLKVSWSKDFMF